MIRRILEAEAHEARRAAATASYLPERWLTAAEVAEARASPSR